MDLKKQGEMLAQGTMLPLMEAFYTIQGEGYHKGSAAYFIWVRMVIMVMDTMDLEQDM